MDNNKKIKWVFMGTPQIAVDFLQSLKDNYDMIPDLIVCNPDEKVGRKQIVTAPPVKNFALENNIPLLQTHTLDSIESDISGYDLFCVFAFGSLLKQNHLDLPKHGVVNIHPSLLPQYRGPSPIVSAILDDQKETGVTLMQLERAMDSGPIIAQKPVTITEWEKYYVHEKNMAVIGAGLFHDTIEKYISQEITPEIQNHEQATYCGKYNKSDMQIDLDSNYYAQYLTYCAFEKPWFFNKKRFVVTAAHYDAEHDKFVILRVVPEGKKERDFLEQDIL